MRAYRTVLRSPYKEGRRRDNDVKRGLVSFAYSENHRDPTSHRAPHRKPTPYGFKTVQSSNATLLKLSSNVNRWPPQSSVEAAIRMSLTVIGVSPASELSEDLTAMSGDGRGHGADREERLIQKLSEQYAVFLGTATQLEAGFELAEDGCREENDSAPRHEVGKCE